MIYLWIFLSYSQSVLICAFFIFVQFYWPVPVCLIFMAIISILGFKLVQNITVTDYSEMINLCVLHFCTILLASTCLFDIWQIMTPEKWYTSTIKQLDQSVSIFWPTFKVIYPKYSKHWLSTVVHTIDCVCSKISNHGINHGLFFSLSSFLGEKAF